MVESYNITLDLETMIIFRVEESDYQAEKYSFLQSTFSRWQALSTAWEGKRPRFATEERGLAE